MCKVGEVDVTVGRLTTFTMSRRGKLTVSTRFCSRSQLSITHMPQGNITSGRMFPVEKSYRDLVPPRVFMSSSGDPTGAATAAAANKTTRYMARICLVPFSDSLVQNPGPGERNRDHAGSPQKYDDFGATHHAY